MSIEVTVIRDLFILYFCKWCFCYWGENVVKRSLVKTRFSTIIGVNKVLELINLG